MVTGARPCPEPRPQQARLRPAAGSPGRCRGRRAGGGAARAGSGCGGGSGRFRRSPLRAGGLNPHGPHPVVMATRIQVGSLTSLSGVPGLGELTQEETLQRAYFRPPVDPPRSAQLLESKSPLRSPVALLPPSRLAPRPFFKDQAPDMKSPATTWGPAIPSPPCGQPPGGVGQEVGSGDGLKRRSTLALNKAEFLQLRPTTTTTILDGTKASPVLGKGVGKGTPEVNMGSTLEPPLGARPEVAAKPAVPARKPVGTLSRPASLLQDTEPAMTPGTGPKEPLAQASSVDSSGDPALDPRPRPKRRPVSAIYMESVQFQKTAPGGTAAAGKTPPTPPEKKWVRRPRPLSMDLTARFESREALLRKGAEETPAPGTAQHQGPERAEPEPRVDGECGVHAENPQDTSFLDKAPKTPEWKEKVLLRQAETGTLRTVGAPATVDTPTCEQTSGDQPDRERGQAPQPPSPGPGKGPDAAKVRSGVADRETRALRELGSRGSLRTRISLVEGGSPTVLAAASGSPPTSPVSPSEAPGPGRAGVNVQDRIKGWIGERAEPRLERRTRTFQARPLSVDLTRLFSSASARPEVRYEKCSEPRDELPQEPRGKKEAGPVSDAAASPRSPRKPVACGEKVQPPEQKGASSPLPDRCPGSSSVAAPSAATIAPDADGSIQTVRATLFEHRVERHTVTTASATDGPLSGPRPRPERSSWLGKDPPENTAPKPETRRWLQSPDAEKSAWSSRCSGEPRPQLSCLPEKPPLRNNSQNRGLAPLQQPEHPPAAAQKVQPLLDVVPAVGERAHSQAVPVAPEETSVTLRSSGSRHWPKGGQRPLETPPGHPEGRSEGQESGQRASLIWEVRGAPSVSGPKADSQEPKGSCPSPRWTRAVAWHQTSLAVEAESGWEQSPDVARPRDPESPSMRTSVISEDLREGRRVSGHRLGDKVSSQGHPPDAPSWGRDTPANLQTRPGADTAAFVQNGGGGGSAGLGAAQVGEAQSTQVHEPQVRMRKAGPSDQRVDRWRRRTLPHDVRFEEFNLLVPEPCWKGEQRRSDLLGPPTAAFRDTPLAHKTEGGSPGGSRDQGPAPGKPASPAEPRATFFAVTYQIPNAQKAKSAKTEAPGLAEPSRKAAPPPSPHLTSPLVTVDRDEAPGLEGSKSWTKGRERHGAILSKTGTPPGAQPPPGGERLRGPGREANEAGALWAPRGSDERPNFQDDPKDPGSKSAPGGAPQANPTFKDPKARDPVQRRREGTRETLPGRSRDGYRSSVLDIDALMAEYRKQQAQGPGEALVGPSAQANFYFPEKPSQPDGPEATGRTPKVGREAEGPWKRASFVETNHSSTSARTSDPGTAPTPKSNGLLWTAPPSTPREKYPGSSAGPEGARNISGPAEDERRSLAGRYNRTKSQASPTEPSPATWVGPGRRSISEGSRMAAAGERSLPDVKRTYSEKGTSAQVREGLYGLQDARERRQEQPQGRTSLPPQSPEARETRRGLCLPDSGQKVQPLGDQEQRPQQMSPVTTSPRRIHSFCRDRRSGPLVDQLKQCFSRRAPEAKDTDILVQEADSQYGTWTGQRQSGESLPPETPSPDGSATSARKQPPSSRLSSPSTPTEPTSAGGSTREQRSASVDRSSAELDSTEGTEAPPPLDTDATKPVDDFAFIDQTSVLDSSALKTRVQLNKRSRRRAPTSHAARRSRLGHADTLEPWEEAPDSIWMFKDSTEEKPPQREESDEEEKPRAERTPVGHTQRMPVFPGVDPAVLKAQLHRRPEADSPGDASSWTPRTPKSPFQPGVLGSRVLPSSMEKDERSDTDSPLWLKELKSKKRQSLYENQA